MSKHTPGPWVIDWEVDETGPRIFTESKVTDSSICRVDRYYDPKTYKVLPQIEANARLIAAAPELLEELKHAVRRLKEAGCITELAETVIDKAEGENK